jgi:hypothetical protein
MQTGGNMSIKTATSVLTQPRELFGQSLPELALVTAIVAAVITATISLSG